MFVTALSIDLFWHFHSLLSIKLKSIFGHNMNQFFNVFRFYQKQMIRANEDVNEDGVFKGYGVIERSFCNSNFQASSPR